MQNRI